MSPILIALLCSMGIFAAPLTQTVCVFVLSSALSPLRKHSEEQMEHSGEVKQYSVHTDCDCNQIVTRIGNEMSNERGKNEKIKCRLDIGTTFDTGQCADRQTLPRGSKVKGPNEGGTV